MKKLFSFLAILISLQGISQTRYIPNQPDSLYIGVQINGTVRKVLVGDLHSKINLRIDSAATAIGNKVDKVAGKQLSTEDYTTAEKTKLAGIAAGAISASQAATQINDSLKNYPILTAGTEAFDPTLYATQQDLSNATANAITDDRLVTSLQSIGSDIKGFTVGSELNSFVTGLTLSDGIIYLVPVSLRKAATLTGVRVVMHTQGAYTADNENRIGLFTQSGSTYTLVASSTNNGALWTAVANGLVTIPFSSTYAATAGTYWIGVMYNSSAETTGPRIYASTDYSGPVWSAITTTATNSRRLYGSKTAATLPATVTASTLAQPSSNIPLVMIY